LPRRTSSCGQAPSDEDEVLALCRDHLAAYKVPRAVQFVDDLPKTTTTGKVLRRLLHTLEAARLQEPAV
jgi:long-chain acyl-CoA synthetase